MSTRKDQRTDVSLPIRIWGMDFDGNLFQQDAHTSNITPAGAKIEGVTYKLHRGAIIGIQCGAASARFRVVWVGEKKQAGQIGVELIEPGKYVWSTPLTRTLH